MSEADGYIGFRRDVGGGYRVYSDCRTGSVEFVGYVENAEGWIGRIPGSAARFNAKTRLAVAELMVRA